MCWPRSATALMAPIRRSAGAIGQTRRPRGCFQRAPRPTQTISAARSGERDFGCRSRALDAAAPPRRSGGSRLLDDDLANHAVIGVGFAVATGNAAAQIGDPPGRYRHEPPFRRVPRIHLDLADRALEFGQGAGLVVARLGNLHLAGEYHLAEAVRGEVVRVAARVLQHKLVELAGLEAQFVGHEGVLAWPAQFDRDHDW